MLVFQYRSSTIFCIFSIYNVLFCRYSHVINKKHEEDYVICFWLKLGQLMWQRLMIWIATSMHVVFSYQAKTVERIWGGIQVQAHWLQTRGSVGFFTIYSLADKQQKQQQTWPDIVETSAGIWTFCLSSILTNNRLLIWVWVWVRLNILLLLWYTVISSVYLTKQHWWARCKVAGLYSFNKYS